MVTVVIVTVPAGEAGTTQERRNRQAGDDAFVVPDSDPNERAGVEGEHYSDESEGHADEDDLQAFGRDK